MCRPSARAQTLHREGARGLFRGYGVHAAAALPMWCLAYAQFAALSDGADEQNRLIDAYLGALDKK
jgi:hypothetical protein